MSFGGQEEAGGTARSIAQRHLTNWLVRLHGRPKRFRGQEYPDIAERYGWVKEPDEDGLRVEEPAEVTESCAVIDRSKRALEKRGFPASVTDAMMRFLSANLTGDADLVKLAVGCRVPDAWLGALATAIVAELDRQDRLLASLRRQLVQAQRKSAHGRHAKARRDKHRHG